MGFVEDWKKGREADEWLRKQKKPTAEDKLGYKAGTAIGKLGRAAVPAIKGFAKSTKKRGGLKLFDDSPRGSIFPKGRKIELI